MAFRRILSGVLTAVAGLAVCAVVAPASAQAASSCAGVNRVCVWADHNYTGASAVYSSGVQVLPGSLDHRISSLILSKEESWIFYSEKYYVNPVFCVGAGIPISDLALWHHNDQFRSMRPWLSGPCPA